MIKKHVGIFALLTSLIFASCEDMFRGAVLEVELPAHTPKLAPYAFFSDTDTVLTVMVGSSVGILDTTRTDVVAGAVVELYHNGALLYTFDYVPAVFGYQKDLGGATFAMVEGDEYELRISAAGFESVVLRQVVPAIVRAEAVDYLPQGGTSPFGDPQDVYNVTFSDPASVKNFYEMKLSVKRTYIDPWDSTVYEYEESPYLESTDPNFTDGIFSDKNVDGQRYTLRLETYSNFWGSTGVEKRFYFRSVSEDYGNFLVSLNRYYNAAGNPFAEPVLLYSNSSSGMGLFGLLVSDVIEID